MAAKSTSECAVLGCNGDGAFSDPVTDDGETFLCKTHWEEAHDIRNAVMARDETAFDGARRVNEALLAACVVAAGSHRLNTVPTADLAWALYDHLDREVWARNRRAS